MWRIGGQTMNRLASEQTRATAGLLVMAISLAAHNSSALAEPEPCRATEYERSAYTICEVDLSQQLITSSNFVGCRTVFLTYQDCAQLGLEARSRGRFSSNVNGTTACMFHVSGITGVRHIIDGNTEYNGYSWPICGWTWNAIGGWTSNSGLNPTVASWAIAAEAKMSIDPAARANCTDFGIVFLRTRSPSRSRRLELGLLNQPGRLCLREDSSRDCGYNKGEKRKLHHTQ
jgi:hypothetical protein